MSKLFCSVLAVLHDVVFVVALQSEIQILLLGLVLFGTDALVCLFLLVLTGFYVCLVLLNIKEFGVIFYPNE